MHHSFCLLFINSFNIYFCVFLLQKHTNTPHTHRRTHIFTHTNQPPHKHTHTQRVKQICEHTHRDRDTETETETHREREKWEGSLSAADYCSHNLLAS